MRHHKKFAQDVESFYDAKDREQGYLEGVDRNGAKVHFSLLKVSAAVLLLRAQSRNVMEDEISTQMAHLKKMAKKRTDAMACGSLL